MHESQRRALGGGVWIPQHFHGRPQYSANRRHKQFRSQPDKVYPDWRDAAIGASGTFAGATTIAAKAGEIIILWATGFGPTTPAAPLGVPVPASGGYSTASSPIVTINNTPALVYGAALAPGSAGLYQIAIQPQRPTPILNDQGDIARGDVLNETQKEISMEMKGVSGVLHGLVGTTEAEEVGCNHPRTTFQHHRNHLAIEITPGRFTMQR
jgi:hypothetical protein